MEARERAKERLAILGVLRAAAERRREIVEAVWDSSNDDEASLRLRELVDIPDGISAQLILDQQIRLFTKEKRDELTAEISRLRKLVQDPSK
jgi:DNA gyrase/topoisomerase IV subunit A